jgi:hypothetical protein
MKQIVCFKLETLAQDSCPKGQMKSASTKLRVYADVDDLGGDCFTHTGVDDCTQKDSEQQCCECHYRRNRKIWKSNTLTPAKLLDGGGRMSWLAFRNGAAGCILCDAAYASDGSCSSNIGGFRKRASGTPLNLFSLIRHGQSPRHLHALNLFNTTTSAVSHRGPTREYLKRVWDDVAGGKASTSKIGGSDSSNVRSGGVNWRKRRQAEFCLADAVLTFFEDHVNRIPAATPNQT